MRTILEEIERRAAKPEPPAPKVQEPDLNALRDKFDKPIDLQRALADFTYYDSNKTAVIAERARIREKARLEQQAERDEARREEMRNKLARTEAERQLGIDELKQKREDEQRTADDREAALQERIREIRARQEEV